MSEPSIRDIMGAYFEGLDHIFGNAFAQMQEHDLSCAEVAADMASRERLVQAFQADADNFFADIDTFWERYGSVVDRYVADLPFLKAVYGGDISPSYADNIACSVGLYMDTIVIPDPVHRMSTLRNSLKAEELLRLTAKHALNLLSYRDLTLAEIDPPVVVIIGDPLRSSTEPVRNLISLADQDLLLHLEKTFGRQFTSMEELAQFVSGLSSVNDVAAAAKDGRRVLFDLDWPDDVGEQVRRTLGSTLHKMAAGELSRLVDQGAGLAVMNLLRGRLMQTNDVVESSKRLQGTPLVDAPTSWQYLLWKYEYDIGYSNQNLGESELENLIITKALQSDAESEVLHVLRVSPKVLIELRRNHALAELREILRSGIHNVTLSTASDLREATSALTSSMGAAMAAHEKQLEKLASSGLKWYGLEVAPMIVSATMSIVGAATGNVPMTIAGTTLGSLGAPTVKDVIKGGSEIWNQYKTLRKSAAGILFRNR